MATVTIVTGVALAATTIASGGTLAAVLAPAITAATSGVISTGFTSIAVKGLAYTLGLSIGVNSLSNAGEIYTGHNTIRDDIMGGNQQAYDTYQNVTNIAGTWMVQTASQFSFSKQDDERLSEVKKFIDKNIPEDFRDEVWDAFGLDIKVSMAKEDMTVYRYYGGQSKPSSYWHTPNLYDDPIDKLALPNSNTAEFVDKSMIFKGTDYLEGTVAPNFGKTGGGYQYYVHK